MLEAYTTLATGDIFPLGAYKDDDFFTLLGEIREAQMKESQFIMPEPPRDENLIKQDIAESVLKNPVFSVISGEMRYQTLADKLKTMMIT